MYQKIESAANNLEVNVINCRRDFHKYAESGWYEMRTSSIIAKKLENLGYEVLTGKDVCEATARMGLPPMEKLKEHYKWAGDNGADQKYLNNTKDGFTGVIGILRCGNGPTVGMRFDIDALGVIEDETIAHKPRAEGFASSNKGCMHACGHDGHASIGLGVAEVLVGIKESLHGTVKLIFQPAEEGVRGARAIVEKGHLDDVDYFLGAHISDRESGEEGDIISGSYGSLATSKYDAYFYGKAAHAGGSPEKGKNAMLAAATAILNLYSIPRHSQGTTRINVGRIEAGTGRNVIADEAKLEIEVRGETTEINNYVEEYAINIIKGAAQMHGLDCMTTRMGGASSLSSDEPLMQRIQSVCNNNLHTIQASELLCSKNSGSEDISYMMERVQEHGGQASFMRLLTDTMGSFHARNFDFDETVLVKGIKIFSAVTYNILA